MINKEKILADLTFLTQALKSLNRKFDEDTYRDLIGDIKIFIDKDFNNNPEYSYPISSRLDLKPNIRSSEQVIEILELVTDSITKNKLSEYIYKNILIELINLIRRTEDFENGIETSRNRFGVLESDIKEYLEKNLFKPDYHKDFLHILNREEFPIAIDAKRFKCILLRILIGLLEEGENLIRTKIISKNDKIESYSFKCFITGLSKCDKNIIEDKNKIFVAYNYKNTVVDEIINDVIKPLLVEYGLEPVIAKEKKVNFDFMCKICGLIRGSRYLLADISDDNLSVGFELGIAVGLQKDTILMAHMDSKEVGDLKRTEAIRYNDDMKKLKEDVQEMLKSVIYN